MVVPNYIPSPSEVPNNVTEEIYSVRLGFVRRVSVLHFLSLLCVAGLSMLRLPDASLIQEMAQLGMVLLLLSLVRIAVRGQRADQVVSLALLPVLLVALAVLVKTLNASGWPVWGVAFGVGCSVTYALLCGRDFSFVGQFFLSLIASSVILAVLVTTLGYEPNRAATLLGANVLYLFYLVYDSASLLARRRLGEEAAAVIDLYRDVFNFFGYFIRVTRHWRKHRIWVR
jgi:hypothetical protein